MYKSQTVRVTTLDSEIKEDVYVLKADVQGWEPHVFAGALKLLQNFNVTFIILELSPYVLCESGSNPMHVANMLNCLGYQCFDGPWATTADKTRKYTKRPEHVKTRPKPRQDVVGFEDWANSVIGFTDLICAKKESVHHVAPRAKASIKASKCTGTVNAFSEKHRGKSCASVQNEVAVVKCGGSDGWCDELGSWCLAAGCSVE